MENEDTPRRVLRDYQARAVRRVREEWASHRAVCLVAPTGSGKTTMGVALAQGFDRVVWVAHRRELVGQAQERLQSEGLRVGAYCPGFDRDDDAPIQVGTIQTLLAGGHAPPADLVVLDEAHHYAKAAKHWSGFTSSYDSALVLGLTATPQRQDGSPLGDIFDELVEAASYSELIAAGHLVPCAIWRAPNDQVQRGWCKDPLEAYQIAGEDGQGFAFYDRTERAATWAEKFEQSGILSTTIFGTTKSSDRADRLAQFSEGGIKMIHNVFTMTEGVDIPAARVCIMAKMPGHVSGYMQMGGRVLRPFPGKTSAILLDISGASFKYGSPAADRAYTLDGDGIAEAEKSTTRKCLECGHVYARTLAKCPVCGAVPIKQPPPDILIYSAALKRVYAGNDTAPEHKRREFERLRRLQLAKGWSLGWVFKEYGKLFPNEEPDTRDITDREWRSEYDNLVRFGASKGYKPGWAAFRFKAMAGKWPPRSWAIPAQRPPLFTDGFYD